MMKHLLHTLAKSHLVKSDFDYHLIRASMVIIFLLFGYQKWFEYEAQVLIPYDKQRAADFLDVSSLRHSRRQLVFGRYGVDILRTSVLGVLEQASGNPRCSRIVRNVRRYCYDHSVHAERMG